ncbi:unnamed protein product [Blepharisma stoltei]|uniref:Uncharacterized protein n=1 Tax=Blepharisma stoltei TaxID=1481888 RepID=A0AAU9KC03_9CILI|nr:unnamed protein product [Blepharisma stoltei]
MRNFKARRYLEIVPSASSLNETLNSSFGTFSVKARQTHTYFTQKNRETDFRRTKASKFVQKSVETEQDLEDDYTFTQVSESLDKTQPIYIANKSVLNSLSKLNQSESPTSLLDKTNIKLNPEQSSKILDRITRSCTPQGRRGSVIKFPSENKKKIIRRESRVLKVLPTEFPIIPKNSTKKILQLTKSEQPPTWSYYSIKAPYVKRILKKNKLIYFND